MPHAHASGFPSLCCDRGGQAPALLIPTGQDQAILTYSGRRRGLKPRLPLRLSVGCARLIATSGSGNPELQSLC